MAPCRKGKQICFHGCGSLVSLSAHCGGFCCSAWCLVFAKTKYRNCDVGHVCGVMLFFFFMADTQRLACLDAAWCKLYNIT